MRQLSDLRQEERPSADTRREPAPAAQRHDRWADRWKRRIRRGFLAALVAALALYVFHAPLFTGLACLLVLDQPLQKSHAVAILGGADGDGAYDEAVRLYDAGIVSQVLVFQGSPSRLTRLGLYPTAEEEALRELGERRLPLEKVTVLRVEGGFAWNHVRRLGEWLRENPEAHVIAVCDAFGSRKRALICSRALEEQESGRIRWRPISDRRFDATNWWRAKQGVLAFADGYVRLTQAALCGEPPYATTQCTTEEYERRLYDHWGR
ncbi:MAG: hypothetical protein KY475_06690 [Planctomycetes bacterium]|nr:hypothetical protein [Planctomycetota bacterium]